MKLMSLLLTLSFSTAAFAQISETDLIREAYRTADAVKNDARYLSPEQKFRIREQLAAIRDTLNGDNGGSYGGQSLTCVSRDNDGRGPYVLAIREGINVRRLSGTTVNSTNECQRMADTIRYVEGRALLCVSRDNDGRSPWSMAMLGRQGEIVKINYTTTNNFQECAGKIRTLRPSRGEVTFCASRDNDGRSPYAAVSLNLNTMQTQLGGETFRTPAECEQFLR